MSQLTDAQQKGLAYAPIPFGVISILSSSYVIYHILFQEPKKRKRLYQRLVLVLNFVLVLFSADWVWSTGAVPKGTPYFLSARGTVATCTAQGFIYLMCCVAIPIYYVSLSLQAYLGIRNNFKEEKYKWIEKWIHAVAIVISIACPSVIAATDNFNPAGTGCWIGKSPAGCEGDLDLPCERGQDIKLFMYIMIVGQACLYFVLPPIATISMYFWLKKIQRNGSRETTTRMAEIRNSARKRMMQCAYQQISVYLFSYWFSWAPSLIWFVYRTLTNNMAYNLFIFNNCVLASQGFVFTTVYFTLHRIGQSQAKRIIQMTSVRNVPLRSRHGMRVSDLRSNVEKSNSQAEIVTNDSDSDDDRVGFNIFDGMPDKDSPWAMFIDCDDFSTGQNDELEEQALPESSRVEATMGLSERSS